MGDSAGGDIVITLTTLAIMAGFRKPDFAMVMYPMTCTAPSRFWPSRLLSMNDDHII